MSAQGGAAVALNHGVQPISAQPALGVFLQEEYSFIFAHAARLTAAPWQISAPLDDSAINRMPAAQQFDFGKIAPWATGSRLASADFCGWPQASVADNAEVAPWSEYADHPAADPLALWPAATVADRDAAAPWGEYAHRRATQILNVWPAATVADIAALAPWAQYAARHGQAWVARTPKATQADESLRAPWGTFNVHLNAGWGVVTPDNNPPTNEHGTIVTPTLRSYIVLNEITLVRVSNSLALPALSLSIAADADSWTYTWQASVPGNKLDDVLPASAGEPIEFEASINGWPHRLIAEQISLDRSFGKERVNISGRGIAALLADPYIAQESRSNASDRTAAQLCDDALLINGVPASGWTIDFNLTDWLAPAGAWAHVGTPMDAITAIAGAAGGYVRADPTLKLLHIEPRYAIAPWSWSGATPDYELPSSATTKVGIEWRQNPPHNVVYVAGTGAGAILGQVKITGTAGDIAAPMATDQLITHADAARQRGLSILGNAGSGQTLTLDTPILDNIGPYPVGSLIKFTDGGTNRLGLVRACAISAGLPRVRQTLQVESHD